MPRTRASRNRLGALFAALVLAPIAALACGQQAALGPHNTVIVVSAGDSLWQAVRDTTYAVLEPTMFTTREEKKFYVEQIDTVSTRDFHQLRTFRRVLVFGTPDNRFVREIVDAADGEMPDPPAIVRARDVWARDQRAAAVILTPEREASTWTDQLPRVAAWVDSTYQDFVRRRMFVSGPDTAAAGSLADRFGFGLTFPGVYDVAIRGEGDGPVVIRNDNPDPADLIRSILVGWRSPPLDSLTVAEALDWRAAVDSVHYNVPQAIDTVHHSERVTVDGRPALEVTGVWSDEGTGYPAAGPFILRLVQCPDRTYFHDAWVYAPGEDRYQYLIQVRTILDSFVCEASPSSQNR